MLKFLLIFLLLISCSERHSNYGKVETLNKNSVTSSSAVSNQNPIIINEPPPSTSPSDPACATHVKGSISFSLNSSMLPLSTFFASNSHIYFQFLPNTDEHFFDPIDIKTLKLIINNQEFLISAVPNSNTIFQTDLTNLPSGLFSISIKTTNSCIVATDQQIGITNGTSSPDTIIVKAFEYPDVMFNYNAILGYMNDYSPGAKDSHVPLHGELDILSNDRLNRIASIKVVSVMRWADESNTEGLVINGVIFGNPCFTVPLGGTFGCDTNYIKSNWINWNSSTLLNGTLRSSDLLSGFDIRRVSANHIVSKALRDAGTLSKTQNAVCNSTPDNTKLCFFEFDLQDLLDNTNTGTSPNQGATRISIQKLLTAKDSNGKHHLYIVVADDTIIQSMEFRITINAQ